MRRSSENETWCNRGFTAIERLSNHEWCLLLYFLFWIWDGVNRSIRIHSWSFYLDDQNWSETNSHRKIPCYRRGREEERKRERERERGGGGVWVYRWITDKESPASTGQEYVLSLTKANKQGSYTPLRWEQQDPLPSRKPTQSATLESRHQLIIPERVLVTAGRTVLTWRLDATKARCEKQRILTCGKFFQKRVQVAESSCLIGRVLYERGSACHQMQRSCRPTCIWYTVTVVFRGCWLRCYGGTSSLDRHLICS